MKPLPRVIRPSARGLTAILAGVLVACAVIRPSAHDIPPDVTVNVFLKPDGAMAHLLVRVPLGSLLDVDWPMKSPDELDLDRIEPFLREGSTLWLGDYIDFYENGAKVPYPAVMGVRAALPSDPSFGSYDLAYAHIHGPALTNDTVMYRNQGFLDAQFDFPIQSDQSAFSIHAKFARLGIRTYTVLHYIQPDGAARTFEYEGDAGTVLLAPSRLEVARHFAAMGARHVLESSDVLLFLLCLVVPFRRPRAVLPLVAAFAVAHSVTLLASGFGMAPDVNWFPPLADTLVALSILYMALENIAVERPRRRWLATFAFGLAYGFVFEFALRPSLQFAGAHPTAALLSFNAGIEAGQLVVAAAAVAALDLLFRYLVPARMGAIILSALVGHTAWHWATTRWELLRQFPIAMPAIDAAFFAMVVRWVMLFVALAGVAWLIQTLRKPGGKGQAVTE